MQFYPLNFKKDLVKIEKMERNASNIIKGMERLPMKERSEEPQHFSRKTVRDVSEVCKFTEVVRQTQN